MPERGRRESPVGNDAGCAKIPYIDGVGAPIANMTLGTLGPSRCSRLRDSMGETIVATRPRCLDNSQDIGKAPDPARGPHCLQRAGRYGSVSGGLCDRSPSWFCSGLCWDVGRGNCCAADIFIGTLWADWHAGARDATNGPAQRPPGLLRRQYRFANRA